MPSTSTSSSSTLFGGGGITGTIDSKKAKLDPPGRDVAVTLPDGTSVREYEAVQAYLRACPFAPPSHPAIVAAIDGVEKELSKRKRDAVLQAKFLKQQQQVSAVGRAQSLSSSPAALDVSSSQELVHVYKSETAPSSGGSVQMNASSDEPDDWHEVSEEHGDGEDGAATASAAGTDSGNAGANAADPASSVTSSTSVGAELTREVISSIALFEARVNSPVQMVAVALHAALRGPMLGFACTGVPDHPPSNASTKSVSGGFAPSVRELPPTQFLPKGWNADPNAVTLRYRKKGVGSMILRVENESSLEGFDVSAVSMDRVWIKVSVTPNASSLADKDAEPSGAALTFPACEYINLSSFQLALNASHPQVGVAPALHYKGLPILLSRFVQAFDLGGLVRGTAADATADARNELPYVDTTVRTLPVHTGASTVPTAVATSRPQPHLHYDESRSPTIDMAFPGPANSTNSRGDFADDLMIGGGNVPPFGGIGPTSSPWVGGNLMGPNHPAFAGGPGISGVGPSSGFGMRPRFDPIGGPPGGPTDVDVDVTDPTRRIGVDPTNRPRRNLGDPNPDHLSPPNSLHSNMFM